MRRFKTQTACGADPLEAGEPEAWRSTGFVGAEGRGDWKCRLWSSVTPWEDFPGKAARFQAAGGEPSERPRHRL